MLFDTGKIIKPAINCNFNRMEQLVENAFAYVGPNGNKTVNYRYFEGDSIIKKLYIPESVIWIRILNWDYTPKKITGESYKQKRLSSFFCT